MPKKKKHEVEEIKAEEVEVVKNGEENNEIVTISADDPTPTFASSEENPIEKMFGNIEELKKVKPFGILALALSIVGIKFYVLYLCPAAILLAGIDILIGSKYTKKFSYAAIIIAILSLLNSWT